MPRPPRPLPPLPTEPILIREALRAGWSRRRLDAARTSGALTEPFPGVLLRAEGASSERLRCAAALKYAGRGSALGAATGCSWHGAGTSRRSRRVVLLPAPRGAADQPGLEVRTTTRPFSVVEISGLRVATVARCVTDLGLDLTDLADVRALVCGAVQRGLVDVDTLADEVARAPRRQSAHLRRAVRDARAGSWSAPEAEVLDLIAPGRREQSRLHRNCLLLDPDGFPVGRPDWHAVGRGVVGQVHSRTHHSAPDDFDDTLWTDGGLDDDGYSVVAVTPRQIRRNAAAVVGRWDRFLERHGRDGDPPGACRLLDGTVVVHQGTAWPPPGWCTEP